MSNIILVFNIRQSVFRHFGLHFYRHAKTLFNMHLLPIVTLPDDGIEQRALKISRELPNLLEKIKADKAHFACYSSSGIDFRFAISQLGLAKHVNTLTTISSPHKGSKLALLSDKKFFKDETIDPIARLSGVGLRAFHEFVPQNMKNFNNCIPNSKDIEYYSMGSQRLPNQCSYSLSETGKYLLTKTQTSFQYYNDGVFGHDEIVWGNHITNFQADHGEVLGIFGSKRANSLRTVKQIGEDWTQKHEKKQNAGTQTE